MNGLLPIVVGGFLLVLGGAAAIRSASSRDAERRQLEGRLKELQIMDNSGAGRAALSGWSQDLPRWLSTMLARADIVPRIDPILLGLVIFVAVAGIALLMLGWIAALAVVVCEFGGTFLALRIVANRRITRFVDDLPFFP